MVVRLRSHGGRRRLRTDRRERSRLGQAVPHVGGLPADPAGGGSAHAGSARRRGGSGRRSRHRARAHPVHRAHERSELDPSVGARRDGSRPSLSRGFRRQGQGKRVAELVRRSAVPERRPCWPPTQREPWPVTRPFGCGTSGTKTRTASIPPTRPSAREWLRRISSAIRSADPSARLTVGLHMEDLENDRVLGPREASEVCDVALDAWLSDLCQLGEWPNGRAAPAVPGRCHALARQRPRRVVRGVWPADLPQWRSGRRRGETSEPRLSRRGVGRG